MSLLDTIIKKLQEKLFDLRNQQANCTVTERPAIEKQIAEVQKKLMSYGK